MKYKYKLSEEIARWAFEVHIKNLDDWWIAFTNPTAGPWKRIESYNKNNIKGEVYRFDIDEKRPDVLIVNDNLKVIVIFEAKDYLNKLNITSQVTKSAKVINDMSIILKKIKNDFWGDRCNYKIYNGLLWGSETRSDDKEISNTFDNYSNALRKLNSSIDYQLQIAIESTKNKNDEITLKLYSNSKSDNAKNILNSLKIQ